MPWVDPPPGQVTASPEELAGWEEVYGPDYPFTVGDVPAIANSLCRVRYDPTFAPGFLIDAWSVASSAWVQQGKVVLSRYDGNVGGAGTNPLNTLIAAGLREYTPDRAVVWAVMKASADPLSRELVYITVQRGWTGPRFEIYAAAGTDIGGTGGEIAYSVASADTNDSASSAELPAQELIDGVAFFGTAGSGSALFGAPATIGRATFQFENWVNLGRAGQELAVSFASVLAGATKHARSDSVAYGASRNVLAILSSGGYCSARIGYYLQPSGSFIEAESALSGSSTTASIVADASASGGQSVRDTQTSAVQNTVYAATSLPQAKYRVFARVKVDAGATGNFQAVMQTFTPPGTNVSAFSPVTVAGAASLRWINLGDVSAPAANPFVGIYAWRNPADTGYPYVDRIEVVKVEDRVRANAPRDGARDLGISALSDIQTTLRRIARA